MLRLLRTGIWRVVGRGERAKGIVLRAYIRKARGWKRRRRRRWFSGMFGVRRAESVGWNQVWMGGRGMLGCVVGGNEGAVEEELKMRVVRKYCFWACILFQSVYIRQMKSGGVMESSLLVFVSATLFRPTSATPDLKHYWTFETFYLLGREHESCLLRCFAVTGCSSHSEKFESRCIS